MTKIFQQDVLQWCKEYEGEKFHALLCDPPYHLSGGFMGKKWDKDGPDAIAFNPKTWEALAEHLLPGAFGMAFASSRGWHRMACAIEDAGLVIHPSIFGWNFGSGFPKATRIDNQIDKMNGAKREVIETRTNGVAKSGISTKRPTKNEGIWIKEYEATKPATSLASAWASHRYGLQALKPALEPIIVFQKPYAGKPLESITKTGAGALNIDGARIGNELIEQRLAQRIDGKSGIGGKGVGIKQKNSGIVNTTIGRWPANFILMHSPECKYVGTREVQSKNGTRVTFKDSALAQQGAEYVLKEIEQGIGYADADGKETITDWECVPECPVRRLGEQSGNLTSGQLLTHHKRNGDGKIGTFKIRERTGEECNWGGDTGTAARFFLNADWNAEVEERLFEADPVRYQAKASRSERDAGLECLFEKRNIFGDGLNSATKVRTQKQAENGVDRDLCHNPHPTVKPIALIKWLASLLLPPDMYAPRKILIPFSGSGSEMIGAHKAGWEEIIGIEQEAEYVKIAEARIAHHCGKQSGQKKSKVKNVDLFDERSS